MQQLWLSFYAHDLDMIFIVICVLPPLFVVVFGVQDATRRQERYCLFYDQEEGTETRVWGSGFHSPHTVKCIWESLSGSGTFPGLSDGTSVIELWIDVVVVGKVVCMLLVCM